MKRDPKRCATGEQCSVEKLCSKHYAKKQSEEITKKILEGESVIGYEKRFCECKCLTPFVCKIDSPKRFISGHDRRGKKPGPRPEEVKKRDSDIMEFLSKFDYAVLRF